MQYASGPALWGPLYHAVAGEARLAQGLCIAAEGSEGRNLAVASALCAASEADRLKRHALPGRRSVGFDSLRKRAFRAVRKRTGAGAEGSCGPASSADSRRLRTRVAMLGWPFFCFPPPCTGSSFSCVCLERQGDTSAPAHFREAVFLVQFALTLHAFFTRFFVQVHSSWRRRMRKAPAWSPKSSMSEIARSGCVRWFLRVYSCVPMGDWSRASLETDGITTLMWGMFPAGPDLPSRASARRQLKFSGVKI